MKRKRNSSKGGNKEAEKPEDEHIQIWGGSFVDLPNPIFVDILLRLGVKCILICKCVCKTWRDIILDPVFAKVHFRQAEPCPLIRTELDVRPSTRVSRVLYLVEPQIFPNFNLGKCLCYYRHIDRTLSVRVRCDFHVKMKLETKLKIPLRNVEMILDSQRDDTQMGCHAKGQNGVTRKRVTQVRPNHQKFKIVNSCNGFICLSDPWDECNDPMVVCNPVTGEYINLPLTNGIDKNKKYIVGCGLGFSPRTNQYKIISVIEQWNPNPITGKEEYDSTKAEIHTLGSGSWRNMGDVPYYKLAYPTYLKGGIYWFHNDTKTSVYIVSFNLDEEQFESIPIPSQKRYDRIFMSMIDNVSMGVLEGCVCICDASTGYSILIWLLKKQGVQQSWTKMFSIDSLPDDRLFDSLYLPINCLKDGTVLMFNHHQSALVCLDPKGNYRYIRVRGIKAAFDAIAYIPSFISLKDAVVGVDVEVLNINSRCGEFKVQGESRTLSLVEEQRETPRDPVACRIV